MLRTSLLLGLMRQVLPRQSLIASVSRHGPRGEGTQCRAFFSGRAALSELAALPRFRRRVVLLPEYLCNVVPLAFVRRGWRVATYAVDERFEPDPWSLRDRAQVEGADVLLLAPLYGADGGVAWALSDSGRADRERLGVTLVLDLCQDAGRLSTLEGVGTTLGRGWAVLTSFNDKSLPGTMGAALWTDLDGWPAVRPPSLAQSLALNGWALRKLLPRASTGGESAFEHSAATRFPYAFDVTGASRLQLALGSTGLAWLPRWQARRRAAVAEGRIRPLPLPHAATAPFVVAADAASPGHRTKAPYATFDDPARSLRPDLRIVHNKGFDDR